MSIELIASVLVGIFGIASVVIFVRGVVGLISDRSHQPRWYL